MTDRRKLEDIANDIGKAITIALESWSEKPLGFALLVFDFGGKGNLAWISNAKREDMLKALQEFMDKQGGESIYHH